MIKKECQFDQDILFEFIPEEDKKSFLVWDNAYCNPNGLDARSSGVARIVAIYRAPFELSLNNSLWCSVWIR